MLNKLFSFLTNRKPVATKMPSRPVNFHVTLWPAFGHFPRFARDPRLQGIRLNSAMMKASEIDDNFVRRAGNAKVPMWFDIKGMQLRIREVILKDDHYEFILNRPIQTKLPCPVWFKAGEDAGLCTEIKNGTHFVLAPGAQHGPQHEITVGESIHIKQPHEVGGPVFLDYEKEKIERIKSLGFSRWCLSYVYEQRHIDEFRELIGKKPHVYLKIENMEGLSYVAADYKPMENTNLFTARGDLWVEVSKPHDILKASRMIIEKDPDALVGSRMLLSLCKEPTVSCADLFELAGLYDMGYRTFLLCDELCLKEDWLATAVAVFDAFRKDYCA
jgi:hypothetical protein